MYIIHTYVNHSIHSLNANSYYYAHRIQQQIPKVPIRNFTNFVYKLFRTSFTSLDYYFLLRFFFFRIIESDWKMSWLMNSWIINDSYFVVGFGEQQYIGMLLWKRKIVKYSNLPNNRVGPFNRVGGRFLSNW